MVMQLKTISLLVGATKVDFRIHRSLELGNNADVAIAMTIDEVKGRFDSIATIIALEDLQRFGEYIESALIEEPDYEFVPMNLGFEFYAYDNDDYVTTVNLFLLSAEPDGQRRSYFGCQGSVLNEMLLIFANELKECAM